MPKFYPYFIGLLPLLQSRQVAGMAGLQNPAENSNRIGKVMRGTQSLSPTTSTLISSAPTKTARPTDGPPRLLSKHPQNDGSEQQDSSTLQLQVHYQQIQSIPQWQKADLTRDINQHGNKYHQTRDDPMWPNDSSDTKQILPSTCPKQTPACPSVRRMVCMHAILLIVPDKSCG